MLLYKKMLRDKNKTCELNRETISERLLPWQNMLYRISHEKFLFVTATFAYVKFFLNILAMIGTRIKEMCR